MEKDGRYFIPAYLFSHIERSDHAVAHLDESGFLSLTLGEGEAAELTLGSIQEPDSVAWTVLVEGENPDLVLTRVIQDNSGLKVSIELSGKKATEVHRLIVSGENQVQPSEQSF